MRQAKVLKNGVFCGIIREDEEGFHFQYDREYLKLEDALPVSPTMPLTSEEYQKEMMFPVFYGLIPEGWLLDIASESWKIDKRDRMLLLMNCCTLESSSKSGTPPGLHCYSWTQRTECPLDR